MAQWQIKFGEQSRARLSAERHRLLDANGERAGEAPEPARCSCPSSGGARAFSEALDAGGAGLGTIAVAQDARRGNPPLATYRNPADVGQIEPSYITGAGGRK
jgi:hypothetical protein